ncbi:MAG: hypothetical protein ACHQ1E_14675, partial [Ktedonobacterales bacterium]
MDDPTVPSSQPSEWPEQPALSGAPQGYPQTYMPANIGALSDPLATRGDLDEAPTAIQTAAPRSSAPRSSAPACPSRGFARWLRSARERMGRIPSGRIAVISVALLLILGIPLLLTLGSAVHDYTTLKGLGQSAVNHLLATKDDLTGHTSSSSSGATSASLSSLAHGSGTTAELLSAIQLLLETPGPDVTGPAYTYLAQRQSGTFYPLTVTVQPAKGIASEGSAPTTFKTTLSDNTFFALGGQPTPTPTAIAPTTTTTPGATATATAPSATPTSGATTGSGTKTSSLPDPARIAAAANDLRAAQQDFQSMADQLDHPDATLALAAMLPVAGADMRAAQSLAHVGVDISQAGLALLGAATPLLTRLHGSTSLLSGTQKLITQDDITALQQGMTVAAARLSDASHRLASVNVSALPLSAHQKALFQEFVP